MKTAHHTQLIKYHNRYETVINTWIIRMKFSIFTVLNFSFTVVKLCSINPPNPLII